VIVTAWALAFSLAWMAYIDPVWGPTHHELSGMATTHICFRILLGGGRRRSAPLQQPATESSSTHCRCNQQMGVRERLSPCAGSVGRSRPQGHHYFVSIWLHFPILLRAVCRSGCKILVLPACLLGDLIGSQHSSIMALMEMGNIGMMILSAIILLVW
jgi:hypothetical protein